FDRRYADTLAIDTEDEAREHRTAVEQDRTGAALAKFAAVLRTAEVQILTQHLEQRFVRCERDLRRFAVDGQGDVYVCHGDSIRPPQSSPPARRCRRRSRVRPGDTTARSNSRRPETHAWSRRRQSARGRRARTDRA